MGSVWIQYVSCDTFINHKSKKNSFKTYNKLIKNVWYTTSSNSWLKIIILLNYKIKCINKISSASLFLDLKIQWQQKQHL